jgi:hypothetical protein
MRALIPIAGVALVLGGCGNNGQKSNDQNVGETLTAENIVSNDVTAIDAVTGDAANMAADVDMNFGNVDENLGDAVSNLPSKPRRPVPTRPAARPEPAAENTTNAASNGE